MDSTQVLCKNDAFVFKFEYKQYRARVTHIARGRSLDVSFGDTQRERSGETVTAKERFVLLYYGFVALHDISLFRLSRPMFKNTFRGFRTVRYEMNTIRQLVSKVFFLRNYCMISQISSLATCLSWIGNT